MKYLAALALFGLTLFVGVKAGKYIGKKRDPRRKQHNHVLNPQGFDDGSEDDNHMHV